MMMEHGNVNRIATGEEFMQQIADCVWSVIVPMEKLVDFQNKAIISNVVPHERNMEVQVIDEKKPSMDAIPATPNLEDAYLYVFNYLPSIAA